MGKAIGRAKRVDGVHDRYIEHAKRTLPRDVTLQGLRIAIDCANGAAYKVAPAVLWELGAEVVTIGNDPNGMNINLNCGSTNPVALQKKVDEVRADIGIALDGDADRVVIVDETGNIIDGDQLMAVIATGWARAGTLKNNGLVATVVLPSAASELVMTRDLTTWSTLRKRMLVRSWRNASERGEKASSSTIRGRSRTFSSCAA